MRDVVIVKRVPSVTEYSETKKGKSLTDGNIGKLKMKK